jgi:hypothetical protein
MLFHQAHAGQHIETSTDVNIESSMNHAIYDLGPWFDKFEAELQKKKNYKTFISSLANAFKQDENIICKFSVTKDGNVRSPHISSSSSNKDLDHTLIELIEETRLSKVPNNVPVMRGMQIEFWKAENKIFLWSQLDKETYSKSFKIKDYLSASDEHPWKTLSQSTAPNRFRGVDGYKPAI